MEFQGAARDIDATLKASLRQAGVLVESFQANLLFEPWTVTTATGTPFRVFTPFWKAARALPAPRRPLPAPTADDFPGHGHPGSSIESGGAGGTDAVSTSAIDSDDLDSWALLPQRPDWAGGLRDRWTPGEAAGLASVARFAAGALADYHRRDEPAVAATSFLSPHLRFGEVSPFQVWHAVHGEAATLSPEAHANAAHFLSEIGWREFNWNILFHAPQLATENIRPEFDAFPWNEPNPGELAAWQQGQTGIPLVDAGMRELWHTGYMHNRVRMVAASFLIKNLLVDWRIGEQWFWDTLVDADEASNPGNWQWVAGSGADAAPYFRVFNPVLQASKFDPRHEYIDRWIPTDELRPEPTCCSTDACR